MSIYYHWGILSSVKCLCPSVTDLSSWPLYSTEIYEARWNSGAAFLGLQHTGKQWRAPWLAPGGEGQGAGSGKRAGADWWASMEGGLTCPVHALRGAVCGFGSRLGSRRYLLLLQRFRSGGWFVPFFNLTVYNLLQLHLACVRWVLGPYILLLQETFVQVQTLLWRVPGPSLSHRLDMCTSVKIIPNDFIPNESRKSFFFFFLVFAGC